MWSNDVLDFIKFILIRIQPYQPSQLQVSFAEDYQKGFEVERKKGFKFKRHHLAGSYTQIEQKQTFKRVAVVGSGIAGCSTAYHLAKKGHTVELFEINGEISSGASGNPSGTLSSF